MIELHLTRNLKEQWVDLRKYELLEKLLLKDWIITPNRWRYKD